MFLDTKFFGAARGSHSIDVLNITGSLKQLYQALLAFRCQVRPANQHFQVIEEKDREFPEDNVPLKVEFDIFCSDKLWKEHVQVAC